MDTSNDDTAQQQSRKDMLQEWLKKKDTKQFATSSQSLKANKHLFSTPSQPTRLTKPVTYTNERVTSKVSKSLFQHGKENIANNGHHEELLQRKEIPKPRIISTTTTTTTTVVQERLISREEQLRLWKEKKQKALPKSTSKPRPNQSSFSSTPTFSSTSSLFDKPRVYPRPVLAVRHPTSDIELEQEERSKEKEQDKTQRKAEERGNDTGNEGGDEAGEIKKDGENTFKAPEEEDTNQNREIESEDEGMNMSAFIPACDESLLKGLGEWQTKFEELLEEIEEKIRLIHAGGISAESARNWIISLKPTYGKKAQYYVLWAIFEERQLLYENANQVYEQGILEGAQPQYELLSEYRAFLDRKAQSDINRFHKTVEALSSSLEQSKLTYLVGKPQSTLPFSNFREPMNEVLHNRNERKVAQEVPEERDDRESLSGSEDEAQKMDINESLLDNFKHMDILTPRVYKSTPQASPHTPPHTPPSIPSEISDFSPVTPLSPHNMPDSESEEEGANTPFRTPSRAVRTPSRTPSRVLNFEAIMRDSVKKVLSKYDTIENNNNTATPKRNAPATPGSYVVLEKVELTKEQSEALGGAQYAVTPVRKFGIRPKNVNREVLAEVDYVYAPRQVLFKDDIEENIADERIETEISYEPAEYSELKTEIKTEIKPEPEETSIKKEPVSDAELADDEDTENKPSKKTPNKNRKRSRSACPLVSPSLGTFESLEIRRKNEKERTSDSEGPAISFIATPHRRPEKQVSTTPANTPKRKKSRVSVATTPATVHIVERDDDEDEVIKVTNVRRSKRLSSATPIKLPSHKKPLKVVFTPNYHRSSNITEPAQLAEMIDMTSEDYCINSD